MERNIYKIGKELFITSDEEIKGGDWTFDGVNLYKWTKDDFEDCLYNPGAKNYKGCKKVILTTDQDLIEDGVQAIDDEFLEWFVKNPSCEFLEVQKFFGFAENYLIIIPQEELKYPIGGYAPGNYRCNCVTCKTTFQGDKRAVQCKSCAIQMTKEEPKQEKTFEEVLDESLAKGKVILEELKAINAKKETLEEAAKKYANDWEEIHPELDPENMTPIEVSEIDFKEGAKWMQERMYSESDKIMKFLNTEKELKLSDAKTIERIKWYFETYFEQFKKK